MNMNNENITEIISFKDGCSFGKVIEQRIITNEKEVNEVKYNIALINKDFKNEISEFRKNMDNLKLIMIVVGLVAGGDIMLKLLSFLK